MVVILHRHILQKLVLMIHTQQNHRFRHCRQRWYIEVLLMPNTHSLQKM
nr:MAG TPA: hypothetical protein [Bacteriophage sp.]